MKKTYVLDTSVLLHDANALTYFEENDIIIPDVVIEELDRHKRDSDLKGRNARHVSKILDKFRTDGADFINGYQMDNGGTLKIEMNCIKTTLPETWPETADNRILRVCKGLNEKNKNVILVSNDIFLRIKASILSIPAQEYKTDRIKDVDTLYSGKMIAYTSPENIDSLYSEKQLEYTKLNTLNEETGEYVQIKEPVLNQYILLKSSDNASSALTYYDGSFIRVLKNQKYTPSGIVPKTLSQKFLADALGRSCDDASLVIAKGPAGTGKTLIPLAVGLDDVMNGKYSKILYLRGNILLDEDIGFLPGTESEKLDWILRPVKDNLEVIFRNRINSEDYTSYSSNKRRHDYSDCEDKRFLDNKDTSIQDMIQEIFDRKIIEIEAVGHMRGRSISNTLIIIDEAQNLTPNQVATLVTRYNEGSKIVLIGDPNQIDSPDLDITNNGLCFAADRMKGAQNTYQITLEEEECKRPLLCLEAIKRMAHK